MYSLLIKQKSGKKLKIWCRILLKKSAGHKRKFSVKDIFSKCEETHMSFFTCSAQLNT